MTRSGTHTPTWLIAVLTMGLLSACSALGGGDTGVRDELAATRARAELEHERVEALEQRLADLERRSHDRETEPRTRSRIDRLIEQNELMLARSQTTCASNPPPYNPLASVSPATVGYDESTDVEQMKQLERRLRAYSLGRLGGLSREQREAMRLLLQKERVLDGHDPWR